MGVREELRAQISSWEGRTRRTHMYRQHFTSKRNSPAVKFRFQIAALKKTFFINYRSFVQLYVIYFQQRFFIWSQDANMMTS